MNFVLLYGTEKIEKLTDKLKKKKPNKKSNIKKNGKERKILI